MWGHVASVLRRVVAALANRGPAHSAPSMAASGLALNTSPQSKPNGPRTTEAAYLATLQRRAPIKCNRNPKLMAQYLSTNLALRKAAYSEVAE